MVFLEYSLEIGSAVNYLSPAANSKREAIPEGGITLHA
jgi:hypothetical protein